MEFEGLRLDGALWVLEDFEWKPLCPKHYLRLELTYNGPDGSSFHCGECGDNKPYEFPREYRAQLRHIENKIDAKKFQKLKYLNIDGEYTPIAEDNAKSHDGKFFVRAILTDSKVGLRLVVYAGEKGKEKTQIFVEPEIKRLAFDQTNTHPSDVFLKLEGTFDDGSSSAIKQAGAQ